MGGWNEEKGVDRREEVGRWEGGVTERRKRKGWESGVRGRCEQEGWEGWRCEDRRTERKGNEITRMGCRH